MGSQQSVTTVSVLGTGEQDSPFAIRRHPDHPDGPAENPPDMQEMQAFTLKFFKNYANKPYLGHRYKIDQEKWSDDYKFITYAEGEEIALNIGSGLQELGITLGKTLGIYSTNCPEWVNTIDASSLYGFVIVSLYDSLGPNALNYLLEHSQMEACIVSQANLDKLMKIVSVNKYFLRLIIVIGTVPEGKYNTDIKLVTYDEVFELGKKNRHDFPKIDPEAPHFICYSSGTTGNPKGVIISHRASVSNILAAANYIDLGKDPRHLSYLPLAHVFERSASSVTAYYGGQIGFISQGITKLIEDMKILKPTYLCAVPRVMYRFNEAITGKLKKSALTRAFFWGCWYAKKFCIDHYLPTFPLDIIAFNRINAMMGGCIKQFVVGGAAMDPNIQEFLQVATGLPVRVGYGLTEAGSGNICSPPDIHHIKKGSIGGPLQNVEVKLEEIEDYDDPLCGQILIGGQCLSSGYLHDEESTKKLFTDETHKWIKTGDVGKWDRDGYLMIVDRMGSIFKLSQGEYVAAESLSQVYDSVPIVLQSFIYGDSSRTFLVAIIVPRKAEVLKFFNKTEMTDDEYKQACESPELKKEILERLKNAATESKLFGYQRINNIAIEPSPWTLENEFMTPTFKLKRKKLELRYMSTIEKLYQSQ
ncbi:AMP-binding enzyme family protein [Trichomonas vaginalis G3]|uniref:AMP-binding enzyme family protein n=1 Tax=Trichomonas vaginalis (strain ATCC PRA-98 / G3) TaxID=412133 RepID=A2F212_TRIV3|nr:long chain fatty acid--CoA ligase family [Trichomonas vaginalis G3]EAY01067.1 AMP-binding enzyme family protein [Trichomonas vaginalis G3]KAI5515496.1 long chain fatty acid--CoA ligase family [Trichomonas vaginalis G3]|eukprot:XP_001313939.1 AMP-binding enzyme family protein [Trichomonas vaginalis G3]